MRACSWMKPARDAEKARMTPARAGTPGRCSGLRLVLLAVFFVVPIGVAAYESFFSWDLLTPRASSARRTTRARRPRCLLRIALRTIGVQRDRRPRDDVAGALGLALLVDRPGRFFAFVRTSIFSAYVVSWVAVALLWMWLLDGNGGIFGRAFDGLPLGDPRLGDADARRRGDLEADGLRDDCLFGGAPERSAVAPRGRGARRRRGMGPPPARHVAASRTDGGLRGDDEPGDELPGVRRRPHHDAGRSGARHGALRLRDLRSRSLLDLSVGRASALTVVFFGLLLALAALQLRVWRARSGVAR